MNDTPQTGTGMELYLPDFTFDPSQPLVVNGVRFVPDPLRTQTTPPESANGGESVPTLWRAIDALGGSRENNIDAAYDDAITDVLAILEGWGFTEHADAPRNTALGRDMDLSRYADSLGPVSTPGGPDFPSRSPVPGEAPAGYVREGRDNWPYPDHNPTPAEQAERFAAIAATSRPTAAEVKLVLDRLAHHEQRFAALGFHEQAADCGMAATMLDRLAVEVLVVDLDRDEMRAQLDRIAANAQPVDDTDVAELVQRAQRWCENVADAGAMLRTPRDLMAKLVGAVNDQVRKLRDMRAARDRMEVERDAARDVLSDVGHGPETDLLAQSAALIGDYITDARPIAGAEWATCLSRLRWDLVECRKALDEATIDRDEANAAAESNRANLAHVAGTLGWVQDAFQAGDLDRIGLARLWGQDAGEAARQWVEALRDMIEAAAPALSFVNDLACLPDSVVDAPPVAGWTRTVRDLARGHNGGGVRFYTAEERDRARCAISALRGGPDMQGRIVDAVATAFGLELAR